MLTYHYYWMFVTSLGNVFLKNSSDNIIAAYTIMNIADSFAWIINEKSKILS